MKKIKQSTVKCGHCAKEYDDKLNSCPFCAEPKYTPVTKVSAEERVQTKNKNILVDSIFFSVFAFVPIWLLMWLLTPLISMFFDVFFDSNVDWLFDGIPRLLVSIGISILFGVGYYLSWKLKNNKQKLIEVQFSEDQKSVCPRCGSHSIAFGRKGYNWKKGFWYRIFDIKGGHYLAGVDSRRVTAHCQSCGHSWVTDEEWLK